jgi:hypothetical protein
MSKKHVPTHMNQARKVVARQLDTLTRGRVTCINGHPWPMTKPVELGCPTCKLADEATQA